MSNDKPASSSKGGGKMMLLVLVACGLLALGAGVAVPYFLFHDTAKGEHAREEPHSTAVKQAFVPFGEVVVNLNEDRLTRYLKVKILLVVEARDEKSVTDLATKKKPVLKNWLIGHLSDKSLPEVSGASGVNKLRREIWHEFNKELFPDGAEKILDIFFEEFMVQ